MEKLAGAPEDNCLPSLEASVETASLHYQCASPESFGDDLAVTVDCEGLVSDESAAWGGAGVDAPTPTTVDLCSPRT